MSVDINLAVNDVYSRDGRVRVRAYNDRARDKPIVRE
jgi:hypothetical protein